MLALLDSGTSRTRLRLWDGHRVLVDRSADVGAVTGAQEGHAHRLRETVTQLLLEARLVFGTVPVVACGMLSSPTGLTEVPHLHGPVGYRDLAAQLVPLELEGVGPVLLIPGVRTGDTDLMRGEETEVTGLRQRLSLGGTVNFLHLGSHDKLIMTDDSGIQGSVTNLNGELLDVLTRHTLLKLSTTAPQTLGLVDAEHWRLGLEAARQYGLSRAVFMVRVGGLLRGATPNQGTSWLLGALAEGNLRVIEAAGAGVLTVLYGRSTATAPFAGYLQASGYPVVVASETDSQLAAVTGAVRLYHWWLNEQRAGPVDHRPPAKRFE